MKKLFKLGLLSVALLATVVVNASEKLNIEIDSETSKIVSISLTEIDAEEVFYIKDLNGVILFSENLVKSPTYTKVFNLSSLPNGLYFVESRTETRILSTPFALSNDSISLVNESAKAYLAPEIIKEANHIKVLVRNDNKVPVTIDIYDDEGILLSRIEENRNSIVYGHYDVSKLKKDKIVVSVSEGDYSFVKEVEL